jgi:hypothetical protein
VAVRGGLAGRLVSLGALGLGLITSAARGAIDACSVLIAAEASQVLGEPIQPVRTPWPVSSDALSVRLEHYRRDLDRERSSGA